MPKTRVEDVVPIYDFVAGIAKFYQYLVDDQKMRLVLVVQRDA